MHTLGQPVILWRFTEAGSSGSGAGFCPGKQRAGIGVPVLPYTFVPLDSCVSVHQSSYFAHANISGIAGGHIQGMFSDW